MSTNFDDLLGPPAQPSEAYSFTPGKTVDLSGGSSSNGQASSYAPGRGSRASSSSQYSNGISGTGISSRGPSSIEGGESGFSLASINPANIMRQLASRPVSELVNEHGRTLLQLPQMLGRTYQAAARRYLRPWSDFARLNPARIVDGLRQASRRGEIQIHIQRNILANVQHYCPNYAFMFLAMLFMFVCTSPLLLLMLAGVGGGWSHALKSEHWKTRPWTLQIGGVQVPLGSNVKMAIMSVPTLLCLHFFLGPVLWSAALCSGGMSLAHAALRDRSDIVDKGDDDEGPGPGGPRMRELP